MKLLRKMLVGVISDWQKIVSSPIDGTQDHPNLGQFL